jgi:plasmid maintenance system antidote protein VapI
MSRGFMTKGKDQPCEACDRLSEALAQLAVEGHAQRHVAAVVGVSESYMSRMKTGGAPITEKTAARLEKHFGYSARWLIHGEGDVRAREASAPFAGAGLDVAAGFRQQVGEGAEANGRTVIMKLRIVPHCPECHAPIETGARVCPHCGKRDLKYPHFEVTRQ